MVSLLGARHLKWITIIELALKENETDEAASEPEDEQCRETISHGKRFNLEGLRFKPLKDRVKEQLVSASLWDALIEVESDVKEELRGDGFESEKPLWSFWLVGLHNRYSEMKVQDFFDPAIPSMRCYSDLPIRYQVEFRRYELFACIGYKIVKKAEARRQKEIWEIDHNRKPLMDDLNELTPPLTWGEIIFHFVSWLTEIRDRRSLRELERFIPAGHCIVCGKSFKVDKYNPGRFRCPTCNKRLRQQRWLHKTQSQKDQ